jgi:hypothetical protein
LSLQLDEVEASAVFSVSEQLLGEEEERKQAVLTGLLNESDDIYGTTCAVIYFLLPH